MDENKELAFMEEQIDLVRDLLDKSNKINESTLEKGKCNCGLFFLDGDYVKCPIRVDDFKLLYIGTRLLPNIANYLVNILPQFLYPYVVAYLQDLTSMDPDNTITINDLFDIIVSLDNGNIFKRSETES